MEPWRVGCARLGGVARLGRFCAGLVVAALVCTGSFGRFAFFTLDWHGLSVVHTAIVGAAVVWLAGRPSTLSWGRTVAASVGLGLIGVLPSASDRLFVFSALIPLLVTGLALEWHLPGSLGRRLAVFSVLAAGVSLVGGALVAPTMQPTGVLATGYHVGLASPGVLATNARLALTSYLYIGGGDFLDPGSGFWALLSGVLMLGALPSSLSPVPVSDSCGRARSRVPRTRPREHVSPTPPSG